MRRFLKKGFRNLFIGYSKDEFKGLIKNILINIKIKIVKLILKIKLKLIPL